MKAIITSLLLLISICSRGQTAKFEYEFKEDVGKAGTFVLKGKDGKEIISAKASAGYLNAANNPYYQQMKGYGPLPSGTWEIYAVKNAQKYIFRLKPKNVLAFQGVSEDQIRDGFLIHGTGLDSTPEKSSHGCIILDPTSRKKLYDYFIKNGKNPIELVVSNIVH